VSNQRNDGWSRREFLSGLTLTGAAAFLGLRSEIIAAEPPPETTKIRLVQAPTICYAPQYLAEELLRGEGFTDVQYVKVPSARAGETGKALASGEADITMLFAGPLIQQIDAGDPIVMLAGVHIGCLELFGTDGIRTIRDLKGKRVAVSRVGAPPYVFISILIANVGLDPRKDIKWVERSQADSVRLLSEKKIDALLLSASPPYPQQLRAKKIGHVVVNSMMDRPWSQYFCCMLAANHEFVRKNPMASKRALRAILKKADLIAREPERTARSLVEKGYAKGDDSEYVLQAMKEMEMAYRQWREYDPEDTVRFYSLRLNEIGMIKNSPQKIIAQGTDWRFLRELKKELKT
jgi:NitT/TauT family transport system substrate-binding protein